MGLVRSARESTLGQQTLQSRDLGVRFLQLGDEVRELACRQPSHGRPDEWQL
jgi:hypothetical protein